VCAALLVPVAGTLAQDTIKEIIIPQGATTPRIAIPDCVPSAGDQASRDACTTVAEVLRADLDFEGLFRFVEPDLMRRLGGFSPDNPDLEAWSGLLADLLAITRARVEGDQLTVDLHVYSLASKQSILEKRYSGRAGNPRFFGHTLSDAILSLTQFAGVARTQIAFASDRDGDFRTKEIYVADYDGHRVQRLTRDESISILPEWSPDGQRIAFTSYKSRIPDVILVPLSGGRAQSVTNRRAQSFAPSWSPDGERIAYASNASGRMKIWVSNADGSGARQITEGPGQDTAPTWSPTGREIAFTSDRSGSAQIWVVGAEGLNLRRLTRIGTHNDGASWSPSKQFSEIAYTSRLEPGRFDIAVISLDSGQVRQITTEYASCESPSWAPSGRHLVFSCRRGQNWQVSVADRLGLRVRTVPTGPGSNLHPVWGPFRDRE
jgi:TolB protein